MSKTISFLTILFSISTQFSSILPIDKTQSGATTLGQNEPRSDSSEGALCIPRSSCDILASPSFCFVSYQGHSLGESYPFAVMQSVYSTDMARFDLVLFLGLLVYKPLWLSL